MKDQDFPDELVDDYDISLAAFPEIYKLRERVAEVLAEYYTGRKARLLEIGCGAGEATEYILTKSSNLDIIAVDISSVMIARMQDRYRFLIEQGRLEPVCVNVFGYIKGCADESFDGVTSSWTIHNFTTDQRQELYQDILRTLRPGGLFVNMDKYIPDDSAAEESSLEDFKHRLKYIYQLGRPDIAEASLKHELADRAPEYIMREQESVEILKELGFKNVRIVMRLGREAVLVAEK